MPALLHTFKMSGEWGRGAVVPVTRYPVTLYLLQITLYPLPVVLYLLPVTMDVLPINSFVYVTRCPVPGTCYDLPCTCYPTLYPVNATILFTLHLLPVTRYLLPVTLYLCLLPWADSYTLYPAPATMYTVCTSRYANTGLAPLLQDPREENIGTPLYFEQNPSQLGGPYAHTEYANRTLHTLWYMLLLGLFCSSLWPCSGNPRCL